jgi:hypothetical protein
MMREDSRARRLVGMRGSSQGNIFIICCDDEADVTLWVLPVGACTGTKAWRVGGISCEMVSRDALAIEVGE